MEQLKLERKEVPIQIRIAEKKDASSINKLKQKVMLDTYINSQLGINEEMIRKSFDDQEDTDLKEYMNDTKYIIAEMNREVIGVCGACKDGVLRTMYVEPTIQRRGIGRKLIMKAKNNV
jgi:N-acetylglutamate synthase-like GNAT family acetyltransferase